jgi:myosin-5
MQSCVRRSRAKKELKALKAEARSVSKFKEISYKLENKVVELTQTLQARTAEKKQLEHKVTNLESQLTQWLSRHEDADAKAKKLTVELQNTQGELTKRDELLLAKAEIEKRLEDALSRVTEKEQAVEKLTEELSRRTVELETAQKSIDTRPVRNTDDSSIITTLKNEVSSLREQLNRANALSTLTRGSRAEPTSPTFAPALRTGGADIPNGNATNGSHPPAAGGRHQRRHSSAGVFSLASDDPRNSADEMMMAVKRNQVSNPRAVSVAYNADEGLSRFRAPSGLDRYDEDPAEEKIRLLLEAKALDQDVLEGLIKALKIPAASNTNPPNIKEILFPANLISLVTNEMWKYGLIPESERFLASVMQTIQGHVMVCILLVDLHRMHLTPTF